MNEKIDAYLEDGCGRCAHYQTPECKVHTWSAELPLLRSLVLNCGLTEEYKWSQPCYTYNGKNVVLVTAFKNYTALAFFKGALLKDELGLLVSPGENSRSSRFLKFTSTQEIIEREATLKAFIFEAIEVEKAGLRVETKSDQNLEIPIELQATFDADPVFQSAFDDLTPGKQRGYLLHFNQAKQAKTRHARITKYMPQIMAGQGMHDAYKRSKSER